MYVCMYVCMCVVLCHPLDSGVVLPVLSGHAPGSPGGLLGTMDLPDAPGTLQADIRSHGHHTYIYIYTCIHTIATNLSKYSALIEPVPYT